MAPLRIFALASMLIGQTVAQSNGDNSDPGKVWAAVAFVNHGETTPQLSDLDVVLTPEGAQQMLRQGSALRRRYLNANNKDPGPDDVPIQNLSSGAINNIHITALSQPESWVVGGATAFFQGLYPASTAVYNEDAGGMDLGRNYPSETNNITDYPLDGYQYPQIQTFSTLDSQYPSLQGTLGCQAWRAETAKLIDTDDLKTSFAGSSDLYRQLFNSGPLEGVLDTSEAHFWRSYEIYELVKYMYTHNATVYNQLDNANGTIAMLEANALELETALTSPHTDDSDDVDTILTIAGRTLAGKIQEQLLMNTITDGERSKLTVMFGSHIPLMSFFHIARLRSDGNSSDEAFSELPKPGATMMFELIGDNPNEATDMPNVDDLRVRFVYRPSADEDEEYVVASLFGSSGGQEGLPWSDFSRQMLDLGVDSFEWCDICQPQEAVWCNTTYAADRNGNTGSSDSRSSTLDPVIAGIVGAVVMLAITALLGLALFLCFGFRLRRAGKDLDSTVGGFKGAERMPDDKDVAVSKGGAQHERVGSWELRDGPTTPPAFNGAGIVTSDFNRHDESRGVDDDGISVTGARVVNTRESF